MPPSRPSRPDRYASHDLADFAQEFLRRDPAYRTAWDAARRARGRPHVSSDTGGLARQWGLACLFRSRSPAARRAGAMARRHRGERRHAHLRAARLRRGGAVTARHSADR
ncbi:transcriptional regulator domain-containing protein [Sphingomonas glacialis]|uniref:transcriptional regulator domain-containing protein n=1 Tax=Sphingomonas glacialis TaxID=658225 RepID=UPI003D692820